MTKASHLIPRDMSAHPRAYWPDYKTSVARSPRNALLSMEATITEETGPVFGHDLLGDYDNNLILNFNQGKAPAVGERVRVYGRIRLLS